MHIALSFVNMLSPAAYISHTYQALDLSAIPQFYVSFINSVIGVRLNIKEMVGFNKNSML